MASRIQEFTASPRQYGKYPWAEWEDGSVWRIVQGEDFDIKPENIRGAISARANKRGKKVSSVLLDGGSVEFQFS